MSKSRPIAAMSGAVFLGAMISLMITINGRLSQLAGQNTALVIIHIAGLITVQLILLGQLVSGSRMRGCGVDSVSEKKSTKFGFGKRLGEKIHTQAHTPHISIEAAETPAFERTEAMPESSPESAGEASRKNAETARKASEPNAADRKASAPFYLYIGGVIGVLMVFGNNICFIQLGTSVTLAAGILGQSLASLAIDTTGFLGLPKYGFNKRKIVGLMLNLFGILLMVQNWQIDFGYLLFALFVGSLTIVQMSINARLAERIGLFRGVRVNYIGGISASLAALIIVLAISSGGSVSSGGLGSAGGAGVSNTGEAAADFSSLLSVLGSIPVYILIGGGMLGVLIVTGSNIILPKIPTIYTSLLNFFGQIVTALITDALIFDILSVRRLLGALLIFIGIAVNVYIEKRLGRKKREGKR
ncbi:MAG: DMT family transporter [Spirochaetales bacterium]|nr:DMT family transporter [Spirochaetales bacterium]